MGNKVKLEVEHLKNLSFLLDNVLGRDGLVSNLFGHYLGMEWVDILVLGSHV
jgi:hypothetical protein